MKRFSRMASVGVVAVLGVGAGATSVSAYSISGGAYTGTATANHTWVYSSNTVSCPPSLVTFSGTATGADTTSFTPSFGGCTLFGTPATMTQSGTWSLKVVAGPDANGYYTGQLTIPTGSTSSTSAPIFACTGTIAGPQTFSTGVRMRNVGSNVQLEMTLSGVTSTGSGPCFAVPAQYRTNGAVTLPGIAVS